MQSPERDLWVAVLARMLLDTAIPDSAQGPAALDRDAARHWLRAGGPNFRRVCWMAGLDPAFVHQRYLAGLINPRALHGNGPDGLRQRRRYRRDDVA